MHRWQLPPLRWTAVRPGSITMERVLFAAKVAVAAGLAWWAAGAADGSVTPYFAPLGVLLVVQPTVYDSLSRAVQRVVGVTAGVLVALLVSHFVGLNGWIMAAVAFVGMLLGWLLRLGPTGVVQIPVSVLLVMVVGSATPGYAWARIVDTLIGVGIGAAAVLLSPAAPSNDGLVATATEPLGRLAAVLRTAGTGIAGEWTGPQADRWLADAAAVVDDIVDRRHRLATQKLGARWNARASRFLPTLTRTEDALAVARRTAVQVRGIARGLTEAAANGPTWPVPGMGAVLTAAAGAVDAYAGWVAAGDPATGRPALAALAAAVDRTEADLDASVHRARTRWGDDPSRWLSLGVVLAGAQRILAELAGVLDRADRG
ncbi:MAG TPA: FUSC family protein [Acidimicrobiales bacterium]|nr:FUSC family protein [Acidimicrobiales bacterium]